MCLLGNILLQVGGGRVWVVGQLHWEGVGRVHTGEVAWIGCGFWQHLTFHGLSGFLECSLIRHDRSCKG